MRTGDGNESDKAVFGQILSNVKKQIKLDSIMVCDSALYSNDNSCIFLYYMREVPNVGFNVKLLIYKA